MMAGPIYLTICTFVHPILELWMQLRELGEWRVTVFSSPFLDWGDVSKIGELQGHLLDLEAKFRLTLH